MAALADLYPMAALGGVFVAGAGIGVVAGAFLPRWRMACLAAGFALGVLAISVFWSRAASLVVPHQGQTGALVAAIVLEMIAFPVLMPRLRRHGPRAAIVGILAIVGAHFLVMYPAFGPLIAALGLACLVNALLVWRLPGYSMNAGWLVDGLLKIGFGIGLLLVGSASHS